MAQAHSAEEVIDGVLYYIEAKDGRRELCLEIPLASLSASQMVAVLGADQQDKLNAQWTGATSQTSTATLSLPTTDSDVTAFLKVRIPAATGNCKSLLDLQRPRAGFMLLSMNLFRTAVREGGDPE